ncbi:MAG: hypothetical protein AB8F78_12475 [Saprospiraceae bacterium]
MQSVRHTNFARVQIGLLVFVVAAFVSCLQPYSPATYRKQNESQQYAMICHDNKRTLRVPAEEWEAHREHGDYRGPCRPRELAGPKEPLEVKHTTISYDNAKPRAEESYDRWAAKQAIPNAYIDSLKAAHESARTKGQ